MKEMPHCPSCQHGEWVRGSIVVVPSADGPVRVSTSCTYGPAGWTCANCGYTDPCGGEIERLLERVPDHVTGEGRPQPPTTAERPSV